MTPKTLRRNTARPRVREVGLWGLLLAPLLAHLTTFSVSVIKGSGWLHFGGVDLLLLLLWFAYLLVGVLLLRSQTRRKLAPRLLLLSYSGLAALGLSELGLRPLLDPVPSRVPWPPTRRVSIAGDAMPGISGEIVFSVNRLGLRGPEVRLNEVDLRILCLGGSTTECLCVTDEKSWPWLLQTKLSRRLSKRVFVGNAGRSGHFSLNHEYMLRHYALAPQFEWAVVFCGVNDAAMVGKYDYNDRRKSVPRGTFHLNHLVEVPHRSYYRKWFIARLI